MKLFVWDFHGVLEKDNELAVVEITNHILDQFGYKERLSLKKCQEFYGLKWNQYFEQLLPGQKPEVWLRLQEACVKFQITHLEVVCKNIKTNDHALKVIKAISKVHDQIVISNSRPESLAMFLKATKLDKYFLPDKAFGADAHRANKAVQKHHLLKGYLKGKNFTQIIYIGDSPRDIELSIMFPGTTYLYSHPGKLHKKAKADYKINDLREILKEV